MQAGLATAGAVPVAAVAMSGALSPRAPRSRADRRRLRDSPVPGAAEIIESDLWEQYAGFGGQASSERPNDGQNNFYVSALQNLDSDMPQYISDNTDDEESHQAFIKRTSCPTAGAGQPGAVPDAATESGDRRRRQEAATNLKSLNVDTSWYLRYRAETNPDFGASFGQAVAITRQPVIPVDDTETPPGDTLPCRCLPIRRISGCRRSPTLPDSISR